ncbi:hypothetical protein IJG72_08500 [bacterium]|nr:hypothetical protein [bacterium]
MIIQSNFNEHHPQVNFKSNSDVNGNTAEQSNIKQDNKPGFLTKTKDVCKDSFIYAVDNKAKIATGAVAAGKGSLLSLAVLGGDRILSKWFNNSKPFKHTTLLAVLAGLAATAVNIVENRDKFSKTEQPKSK